VDRPYKSDQLHALPEHWQVPPVPALNAWQHCAVAWSDCALNGSAQTKSVCTDHRRIAWLPL